VKVIHGGWGTVSNLPVALDGSCNGLQHYSAALRDPVGGAAVNLMPSEKPQDIYGVVAQRVVEHITALKDTSGPEGEHARAWLEFGVDRKITKRPVMTLPYGCTLFTVREFVEQAAREKLEGGKPNPFARVNAKGDREDGLFDAAGFLQPIVWEAIGHTVVAARGAMDWLQKVAHVVTQDGLPVVWNTPDGFTVMQAYVDQKSSRVRTHLDGKVVDFRLAQDGNLMDRRRQANGIAPNWVHSMDAAALRVFVNMAGAEGLTAFSLVHDSYGMLAADVPTGAAVLRRAFISLYQDRDALAEFREEMSAYLTDDAMGRVPPVPPSGTLDLSLIEGSLYFFA
jgi:DNA-directed RNA polymerase